MKVFNSPGKESLGRKALSKLQPWAELEPGKIKPKIKLIKERAFAWVGVGGDQLGL